MNFTSDIKIYNDEKECAKLRAFVNYVPYVPTCFTCSPSLHTYVPSCLCHLRAFLIFHALCAFIFYVPYVPSYFTYLTCLCFFSCLAFLLFLRVLRVFTSFKCFHFFVMPYAPWPFSIKCRTTLSQLWQPVISKNEVE